MKEKIKLSPVGATIDALYKIKALAQAAAFLDGNDDEKLIMIELLDVISETARMGIEKNG